jgi:hypothetical protein
MSRKLMAALLSSALVLGNVSTSAWSAPDVSGVNQEQSVQSGDQAKNQAPLPPAGAAGIKQAQGFVSDYPLLALALVVGAGLLIWLLVDDDDDDEEVPSTGT